MTLAALSPVLDDVYAETVLMWARAAGLHGGFNLCGVSHEDAARRVANDLALLGLVRWVSPDAIAITVKGLEASVAGRGL